MIKYYISFRDWTSLHGFVSENEFIKTLQNDIEMHNLLTLSERTFEEEWNTLIERGWVMQRTIDKRSITIPIFFFMADEQVWEANEILDKYHETERYTENFEIAWSLHKAGYKITQRSY